MFEKLKSAALSAKSSVTAVAIADITAVILCEVRLKNLKPQQYLKMDLYNFPGGLRYTREAIAWTMFRYPQSRQYAGMDLTCYNDDICAKKIVISYEKSYGLFLFYLVLQRSISCDDFLQNKPHIQPLFCPLAMDSYPSMY